LILTAAQVVDGFYLPAMVSFGLASLVTLFYSIWTYFVSKERLSRTKTASNHLHVLPTFAIGTQGEFQGGLAFSGRF
jgi:hypothetical protein